MISDIFYILKMGKRWRDVPPDYGPATTIYNGWSGRGAWQRLFENVAAMGDVSSELLLDSTHVKAHRSASGAKRREWAQAVDRPPCGRTSKVHCVADHCGWPAAFALT